MTRITRILANALTAGCVLGMLAIALLCVRSLRHGDALTYLPTAGRRYTVRSVPGGIEFGLAEHLSSSSPPIRSRPAGPCDT